MWPWTHLAVGYVLASLWRRLYSRRPLADTEALAVLLGTQLPDLVDKPLGWGTTLIPAGRSLGHSLLVAAPVSAAAYLIARRYGRPDVGAAFAIGYLSHLPGDVVFPLVFAGDAEWQFLFWPLVRVQPSRPDAIAGHVLDLAVAFVGFLRTPEGFAFLVAELGLLGFTALLWWRDGWPGLGLVRDAVRA